MWAITFATWCASAFLCSDSQPSRRRNIVSFKHGVAYIQVFQGTELEGWGVLDVGVTGLKGFGVFSR